jgi:hypothetical protein
MIRNDSEGKQLTAFARFVVAGFAVIALVAAELVLSAAIHGTNYNGGDGKLAQATILTAYKFEILHTGRSLFFQRNSPPMCRRQ